MPTRKPTMSESARLLSSRMRCAAASVSFMTCGRGRLGAAVLGLDAGVDEACVMSVMWSDPGGKSMPPFFPENPKPLVSCSASPHIEDEARLVAHPVRRPRRLPDQIDTDHADAGNAECVSILLVLISAVSVMRTIPAP